MRKLSPSEVGGAFTILLLGLIFLFFDTYFDHLLKLKIFRQKHT